MSRILCAWELGANLGHLTRVAPIAEKLRAAGHQVLFAVRDVQSGARVLGAKGFAFAQAPSCHRRPGPPQAPGNHAEMLALEGYADPAALWGMVRGWITLVQLFRADVILADYSPGALIAGRILGLPQAQIGHGFEIPPQVAPLPSIRPWENLPQERLQRSEQGLVESINGAIRSFRGPEVEGLADLFKTEARILATFPELDPFGPRLDERYVGPIYEARSGDEFDWPDGDRPRIYAYLRPNVRAIGNILRALKAVEATTICFIPELGPASVKELASDRLRITTRPLRLDSVMPRADLAVLYGGHGVMSASLAMGVSMLMAPQNVEQYLHARCVEALGAGAILGKDTSTTAIAAQLEQTLIDNALKAGAKAFAARHPGFDPAGAIEEAVKIMNALAVGKRGERSAVTGTPPSAAVPRAAGSSPGDGSSRVRHEPPKATGRRVHRKRTAR